MTDNCKLFSSLRTTYVRWIEMEGNNEGASLVIKFLYV